MSACIPVLEDWSARLTRAGLAICGEFNPGDGVAASRESSAAYWRDGIAWIPKRS
jgi:hypothetical protein